MTARPEISIAIVERGVRKINRLVRTDHFQSTDWSKINVHTGQTLDHSRNVVAGIVKRLDFLQVEDVTPAYTKPSNRSYGASSGNAKVDIYLESDGDATILNLNNVNQGIARLKKEKAAKEKKSDREKSLWERLFGD